MPINKPEYQLPLALELEDDTPLSASQTSPQMGDRNLGGVITPEEARLRSETARTALEGRGVPWLDEYLKLREGGWHWRVAAYIAWASSPRKDRVPGTQDELAQQYLGLTSDRAIATWRKKNPVIDEMVSVLQSAPLWDHRADVFAALVENAKTADYKTHYDRKLYLEMTGDYTPSAKLAAMITKNGISNNDLADMSDEELLAMARKLRDEAKDDDASDKEQEQGD